jgi:two-component system LytT family response regulator
MTPAPARKVIRVLIVDDEVLARQRVEDLLRSEEGVEIVAQASTGDSAIQAIREWKPDLVFLDVQMPGKTGLDVIREIGPADMPPTIFVTAFDQHALAAFELAAVDYLVKPFDDERFEQALHRARRMIELEQVGRLSEQLVSLLQGARAPDRAARSAQRTGRVLGTHRRGDEGTGTRRPREADRLHHRQRSIRGASRRRQALCDPRTHADA